MLRSILVATALVVASTLFAPVASAAPGSISGTVTDASTSDPIEDIEVCAYPEDEVEEEEGGYECVLTGSDGSYAIAELAAGNYFVEFWPGENGYRGKDFEGVAVGDDEAVDLDVELIRRAAVKGTVLATEDGLPVEEVEVCAIDVIWNELVACAWTGPDGTYTIPLYAGEFKVEFWPGPSGRNLALQFYDHQDRWNDATVLSLSEGEWELGVDADLGPGATLAGHVSDASGNPLEEVRVCSIYAPTGQLWICTWTGSTGKYSMRFHSPGDYKVVFSPELTEFFPEGWPEDDGFPTEFWDNQTTLAAANIIPLSAGQSVGGINAVLGTLPAPPPVVTPPAAKPPIVHRKRKCRRGFRKKRVKGKVRCVKVRKHRKHRKQKSTRPFSREVQFRLGA